MKKYDLHMHSTFSDGSYTPEELLQLSKEKNISGISITDHDTVGAYSPELFKKAKELNIDLITGVEYSSYFDRFGVHILGYFVDTTSKLILSFCNRHQERRRERNLEILRLLSKKKMEISEEELYEKHSIDTVGRPHIASLMVEKGYVKDFSAAFQGYIGEGKCCYYSGEQVSIEETIKVIHEANGLAFLAHPIMIKRRNLLKKILSFDFDGVECYYANFPRDRIERFLDIAKDRDLLISGGSDFHGGVKPYSALGSSFVQEEVIEKMRLRL